MADKTRKMEMEIAIKTPMNDFKSDSLDMVVGYDETTANIVGSAMADLGAYKTSIQSDITINEAERKVRWGSQAKIYREKAINVINRRAKNVLLTRSQLQSELVSNTQILDQMQVNIVSSLTNRDTDFFQKFAVSSKPSAQITAVLMRDYPMLVADNKEDAEYLLNSIDEKFNPEARQTIEDLNTEYQRLCGAIKAIDGSIGSVVDMNVVEYIKSKKVV